MQKVDDAWLGLADVGQTGHGPEDNRRRASREWNASAISFGTGSVAHDSLAPNDW